MQISRYPSIGQFRNVIKEIKDSSSYVGKDEDGNPIFDRTKKAPTLTFTGTTKLHGTNFCCAFNSIGEEYHFQSRERIITPQYDNAGSALFGYKNLKVLQKLKDFIVEQFNIIDSTIYIFGEIAGKGIQKGVGISEIEKYFYIFDVKIVPNNNDSQSIWLNISDITNRMVG